MHIREFTMQVKSHTLIPHTHTKLTKTQRNTTEHNTTQHNTTQRNRTQYYTNTHINQTSKHTNTHTNKQTPIQPTKQTTDSYCLSYTSPVTSFPTIKNQRREVLVDATQARARASCGGDRPWAGVRTRLDVIRNGNTGS